MKIGRFTYGSEKIRVYSYEASASLSIGSFCSIADNVQIFLGGNHRSDRVTTFPFGHIFTNIFHTFDGSGHPGSNGDVIIKNDVWIASNVTIMSGVTIGNGAVLACNSHIIADVPAYSITGGNPASIIKYRFDSSIIERLENIAWWYWPEEKINKFLPLMCDSNIDKFLEEAEKI